MNITAPNTVHFVNTATNASLYLINALHGSNDVIDVALRYIERQRGNEEGTI
jgi:hypothetical protein